MNWATNSASTDEPAAPSPPERRTYAPPRLTADQVDDAIRLYESGWSLARVGERLDVDPTTVLARLRERGTPTRDSYGRSRY